jgi:hypothetical protein
VDKRPGAPGPASRLNLVARTPRGRSREVLKQRQLTFCDKSSEKRKYEFYWSQAASFIDPNFVRFMLEVSGLPRAELDN